MKFRLSVTAIFFTCVPLSTTLSATLPEGATELSSQEVRSMYEGKSSDWKSVRIFFASDGSAKMVRKDKKAYGEGNWKVSGNKMCLTIETVQVASGKKQKVDDCYTWHKSGEKYFMRWSGDEAKADAYRDNEPSRLSKGDRVSKEFAALKK
ncbi:hypothetical protein GGQ99_002036 [Aminobacter niigataensis]|uniref:DUF995 domain-containing protein n=1 Tax=Aminobacter niigataensis TaxID=83265 RepID=A0ABR6L2M5_9HYPH|nr:DUF995 domain-containing protein [Aminobacter niigataensis]MBB4650281.1 hypothetical protein [Aminobacter niigataensis]